jgi:hypothetical protein
MDRDAPPVRNTSQMLDRREFLELGLAAAPALLFAGRPVPGGGARPPTLALVTADTEAHVAIVSLRSMRVIQRLRTVEDPRSIQRAGGGRALLAHSGAGAVSLLAGRPLRVRRVLRGFGTPRYTAVAGRLAYVSDSAMGEIAVIDLDRGRVLRRVAVGDGARHLALRPGGHTLWVALGSSAAQIAVVDLRDPERPRLAGHVRPPFLAHDIGFSPSGRRVWVTAGREPRIAVYAAGMRALTRELSADAAPQHIAFGRALAYVSSGEAGTLCLHALSDARLRHRTRIPAGSYNIEHAHARVVTPSLGTGALSVLDARGAVLAQVHAAAAAHDVCLLP